MSVSSAKLLANRINARKSTGPRTPRGKAIAAGNSLKHGLFSRHLLLPGESAEELMQLKISFIRRLNPRDPVELELVERVVSATWKLRRLQHVEAALFERECREWADDPNHDREAYGLGRHQPVPAEVAWQTGSPAFRDELERLAAHERQLENAMYRTLRQLALLQKQEIHEPVTEFALETVAAEQSTMQNRENEATATEELTQRATLQEIRERRADLRDDRAKIENPENEANSDHSQDGLEPERAWRGGLPTLVDEQAGASDDPQRSNPPKPPAQAA